MVLTHELIFFGAASEIAGMRKTSIQCEAMAIRDLRKLLMSKYPGFSQLAGLAIAVNHTLCDEETIISENAEIALLPPVSGG